MSSSSTSSTSQTGDSIHPYTRIFAVEIQQSDQVLRGKDPSSAVLITPSGARVTWFYSCGAITTINRDQKNGWSIRVADPTGVLLLMIKTRTPDLIQALDAIQPPAFVSVTGYIEPEHHQGGSGFRLILETIHRSDREERDRWILRTALVTIHRLDRLSKALEQGQTDPDFRQVMSRYGSSKRQVEVLAGIVERAIQQIQIIDTAKGQEEHPITSEDGEVAEKIMKLVKDHSGPRGISVQELTDYASKERISEPLLMDTIRTLIAEDELYQPSSGYVKIL